MKENVSGCFFLNTVYIYTLLTYSVIQQFYNIRLLGLGSVCPCWNIGQWVLSIVVGL